jgi:hypothetical protein
VLQPSVGGRHGSIQACKAAPRRQKIFKELTQSSAHSTAPITTATAAGSKQGGSWQQRVQALPVRANHSPGSPAKLTRRNRSTTLSSSSFSAAVEK